MADKGGEFQGKASGVWEEDEAAARRPALSWDKGNHFINRGPMWHERTIDPAVMFYYHAPFFTAVKRIMMQLELNYAPFTLTYPKKEFLAVTICDTRFPSAIPDLRWFMRSTMQGLPAQLKLVGEVLRTNSVIEADSHCVGSENTWNRNEMKGKSVLIPETTQISE